MKRILATAVLSLIAAPLAPPAGASHADMDAGRYQAGAFSRDYYVYEPASRPQGPVPLVVYLHGCSQDAHQAAAGVRWNETAEDFGFVVAYPEQDTNGPGSLFGTSNGSGCWNWFRPENNQSRGSGEPATIAGITQRVITDYDIDPRRVYILGASAGGAMSVVLAATYPDLYAAFGSLAACPYASCTDFSGVLAYEAMGEHARVMPAFILHGTADPVAPYPGGVGLVSEWLGVADLADDGEMNGSVSREPASIEHHGLGASILDGLGVPSPGCFTPNPTPSLGCALGFEDYPHTVVRYAGAGHERLVELWTGHGAGHAYPNGDPQGSFTDPVGPDINVPAYGFFLANPMPVRYEVSGFLEPLDTEGREFNRNAVVPAKFRVEGGEPGGLDTDAWTIERLGVDCETSEQVGEPEPAPSRTPSDTIRYDEEHDRYVYNADFRDVDAPSCWSLRVTLDDGPPPTSFESPVFKIVASNG